MAKSTPVTAFHPPKSLARFPIRLCPPLVPIPCVKNNTLTIMAGDVAKMNGVISVMDVFNSVEAPIARNIPTSNA